MLNISPTTATPLVPPVYALLDRDFDGDDEDAVLDVVPHRLLNQDDMTWELPEAGADALSDSAIMKAANYYRGTFIDIVA